MSDPDYFPPPRNMKCPFDPPPELLRRQREEPVSKVKIWNGQEAWLITRYEDGRFALRDDRFSANPWRPNFPEKSVAYAETLANDRNIRALDNPEHDVMKRMIISDFTIRNVERLRPQIEVLVDELIDDILKKGPPVDLVPTLAFHLPTNVICLLLGVPYEDHEFFGVRSKSCMAAATAEEARTAGDELNDYFDRLIDVKTKTPADDMISRLVHEQLIPGHLERSVVISLGRLMLTAGHETTTNGIALSILALFQNPEAREEFRTNDDRTFTMNAVDELMRYLSVVHSGRRRIAIADVELGGKMIRAGDGVIIHNSVMDRDESVFKNADVLDLRRPNVRASMTFGDGIHKCPGQYLTRVEHQVVLTKLWRRIPTLRLAVPFEEIEFFEDGSVFSVKALPAIW